MSKERQWGRTDKQPLISGMTSLPPLTVWRSGASQGRWLWRRVICHHLYTGHWCPLSGFTLIVRFSWRICWGLTEHSGTHLKFLPEGIWGLHGKIFSLFLFLCSLSQKWKLVEVSGWILDMWTSTACEGPLSYTSSALGLHARFVKTKPDWLTDRTLS